MKKIYNIVLATTFILLFGACSTKEKKAEEPQAGMNMPMSFETIKLSKSNPSVPFRLPGELIADQEVQIYAKVSSYVQTLKVDVGSKVSQGQVLMTMEAPEINSQLASALSKMKAQEAIYIATKSTYDRTLKAAQTEGAVSQDAIDQITAKKDADEAQYTASKSVYQEIKAMENYLVIRAPFSGIITERNADIGAYVGPAGKGSDKPLLVVQKDAALRLVLAIPEAHTPYVQLGDTVKFSAKSIPQKVFTGFVVRKAGALDSKLRAERIEIDVQNQDNLLLPRMIVDANITLQSKEPTFFIPKSALVDGNMGVYVMKIVEGKTQKTPVRKGRTNGMTIEIFGNLEPNDEILLKVSEETKENISIPNK